MSAEVMKQKRLPSNELGPTVYKTDGCYEIIDIIVFKSYFYAKHII